MEEEIIKLLENDGNCFANALLFDCFYWLIPVIRSAYLIVVYFNKKTDKNVLPPDAIIRMLKFRIDYTGTVIQGIPNHWEFRVSPRNLLKKFKQSMHFVNLNFVL